MAEIRWHEGTALHMQIKENKGVTWLTYPAFEQFADIVHGFSTRLGGVSEGIYASMNLSFTRGDKAVSYTHLSRSRNDIVRRQQCGKRADLQLYFSRYHCSCLYRGAVWRNVSHE